MPVFCEEDPVGWMTRAETYFEVQNTSEEVKIKLAKLSIEGVYHTLVQFVEGK